MLALDQRKLWLSMVRCCESEVLEGKQGVVAVTLVEVELLLDLFQGRLRLLRLCG